MDSWTAWFAPLCGQEMARPIYKAWRQCHEGAYDRKTRACTNGCGWDAKAGPQPARCGAPLDSKFLGPHAVAAPPCPLAHYLVGTVCAGLSCGEGGALWSPLALQRWAK